MNKTLRYLMMMVGLCVVGAFPLAAMANVVINATRVIYPENEREVTVKLNNDGKSPVLVQSWIDNGDIKARPDLIKVPFVLTPPINRVDAGKSQTLRLSYTNAPLAADRETVFWLNVLEIPQAKMAIPNRLQVAFRSRIKLLFRPRGLTGNAEDAAKALTWTAEGHTAVAHNNSPFYVSLVSVALGANGKGASVDGELIPPFGSYSFTFKNASSLTHGAQVAYTYVNDWGAMKRQVSIF